MSRKPNRKVFQRAALAIFMDGERYCCCALDYAAKELGVMTPDESAGGTVEEEILHELYRPRSKSRSSACFGFAYVGYELSFRNQERRIFALLLAAEIVRDPEDLP